MLSVEDAQAIDQLIVFVQCSNGFGKSLLFELILDGQAQLSELFDIAAGVKLQLPEFGQDGKRLFQLCRVWLLGRLRLRVRLGYFACFNDGPFLGD